jgi:hypothetical protein
MILVEVTGAVGFQGKMLVVSLPIALGGAFGLVGFNRAGELRNRKAILAMAAVLVLTLAAFVAFVMYATASSTDV